MTDALGRVHAFLAGLGVDGRGRTLHDVIGFDDTRIESVHDFIQWLFPSATPSRAVPGSPVLGPGEAEAIRADPRARAAIAAGLARMTSFYKGTTAWLRPTDHNHLRITRILTAVRSLLGDSEARGFHDVVVELNGVAGGPVNAASLAHWRRALDGEP